MEFTFGQPSQSKHLHRAPKGPMDYFVFSLVDNHLRACGPWTKALRPKWIPTCCKVIRHTHLLKHKGVIWVSPLHDSSVHLGAQPTRNANKENQEVVRAVSAAQSPLHNLDWLLALDNFPN